ncbi:MAG: isoleucine--tRNA ligase [Bacteroidota bacterium]
MKYPEFSGLNLPKIEQEILAKWKSGQAFEKSISLREGRKPFVFYEGPPSANGMPGIHHVISRTLKDMVCRYKTMQGFQVKRKGGWDTHGLPVELGVEKELGITKEDIGKKISVEEYNQKCREAVLRYKDKWDELTTKMGYWVDLNDPYITFENDYIETLWWILSELYKKGLLYQSVSIQPYSPAAGTGLSSHELNQPGTYKDVKDTSAVAMFKALKSDKTQFLFDAAASEEVFFMAWTTTPWTLPSNLGLTVGENIDYVLVKTFNPYTALPVNIVLAKALVEKYLKVEGENGDFENYTAETKLLPWKIIAEFKGKQIEESTYEQLLAYEANSPAVIEANSEGAKPFRVIVGDFVTTEDGTGIVHTAPAFGADDYKVGKKFNIGILTMVDRQGKFLDGLGEFSNRYVKNYKDEADYQDVNVDICVKLKKENRAFKVEKYEHSYPHCWRTDKPILYYPLDAWFIKTTAVKDRMVELNKTINWKPKSTGEGRFGNWLENMVDWNLSRSRYWGTPLPIWRTEDAEEEICIGSIEALNAGIRKANEVLGGDVNKNYLHDAVLDLHKPFVDDIILVSPSGKPMKRVSDLVDVWFDSGAMPYAQWHYPFENKDMIDKGEAFPADFIAEGVDQTRGWFYTLHALGVMLFDSVAYKAVVSNGLVLDKNGNKMSKRLGNVVNPFETIEKFGADATRWYLITNASPWDNLKFDLAGIQEVQRKFFGTLYNTYQFFALYANVDAFAFSEAVIPLNERPEIDRWILSSLNSLVQKVTDSMNDFEPTIAGRAIETFVDEHLSNWYVRLCRRRFWKGEYEADKISAYQTLYECLETIVRLMAPISPFFSDAMFQNLNLVSNRFKIESIHHADFPVVDINVIDKALEERMQLAQDVCSLVLSLRKKVNIKVRQPLQKVLIPVLNPEMKHQLELIEDLIIAEVNVKELVYITETEGIIKKKIKPNFKLLGTKMGAKMKAASAVIVAFSQQQIATLEKEGQIEVLVEDSAFTIELQEVEIAAEDIPGWSVASKGGITVALDIILSDELKQEGDAREFVNRIQNIRKENGFELTDRIFVKLLDADAIKQSIIKYNDYICREILAEVIEIVPVLDNGIEIDVNDILLKVVVTKKG